MAKRKKSPFKLPETAPLPKKNPRRFGDYDMQLMPPRPPFGGYSRGEVTAPMETMPMTPELMRHILEIWNRKHRGFNSPGGNPFMSLQENA